MDQTNESRNVLNGWKEIAGYLGKSVRSVQRWEVTLQLPVHRIKTPDGQIVYADPDEIDEWRRRLDAAPAREVAGSEPGGAGDARTSEPSPTIPEQRARHSPVGAQSDRPGRRWVLLTAGFLLFLAGVGLGYWRSDPDLAVEFRLLGRSLEALGHDGRLVWSHTFDREVTGVRRGRLLSPQLTDLDGDGELEVLLAVQFAAQHPTVASDALYCFSRDGVLKWRVQPDQTLSFGNQSFSAPWRLEDLAISSASSTRRLWLAFSHHTWWPGFVMEVDSQGRPHLKHAQAGRIWSLAYWTTPAGGFVAAGGTSHEHRTGALVLLGEDDAPSRLASEGPGPYHCSNCPTEAPRRIFLFHGSELTRYSADKYYWVNLLRLIGTRLSVYLVDGVGRSIVLINPDFSIHSWEFADRHWTAHRDLEAVGQLQHPADACPDRHQPQRSDEWTRDAGWRTLEILPSPDAMGDVPPGG